MLELLQSPLEFRISGSRRKAKKAKSHSTEHDDEILHNSKRTELE